MTAAVRPVYLWALGAAVLLYLFARTKTGEVYIAGAADAIGGTVRGLRNNNPGNIRHSSSQWQGMSATQTDGSFVQFDSMVYGVRAIAKLLQTYHYSHGLNSVADIISRWAPGNENNTAAYIAAVSDYLGVQADDYLDWSSPWTLFGLVRAIIRHENGLVAAALISDATINDGLLAANT